LRKKTKMANICRSLRKKNLSSPQLTYPYRIYWCKKMGRKSHTWAPLSPLHFSRYFAITAAPTTILLGTILIITNISKYGLNFPVHVLHCLQLEGFLVVCLKMSFSWKANVRKWCAGCAMSGAMAPTPSGVLCLFHLRYQISTSMFKRCRHPGGSVFLVKIKHLTAFAFSTKAGIFNGYTFLCKFANNKLQ
jgi:hypothetical protein